MERECKFEKVRPRPTPGPTRPVRKEIKFEELEPVIGTSYCTFSVVENKLAVLYRNQEKMYKLLQELIRRSS